MSDDLGIARDALRWIEARLKEGASPSPGWGAVVAFGLTGEPADAIERYRTDTARERAEQIQHEARAWYHRALPGGMPVDWIIDEHAAGARDLTLPVVAAGLSLTRRLHVDDAGEPCDYRNCALCAQRS